MLRIMLSALALFFCLCNLSGQIKNNVRLNIDAGFLPLVENAGHLGLAINVEPRIKIIESAFIGLRIGLTLNSHKFDNSQNFEFQIDTKSEHAILAFMPCFGYYLSGDNIRPYLGIGLGVHLLPDPIEIFRIVSSDPSENIIEGRVGERFGLLLRAGLERGRLRLGVEYNYLAKGDIIISNDQTVGTVENSNLALTIGYTFGEK